MTPIFSLPGVLEQRLRDLDPAADTPDTPPALLELMASQVTGTSSAELHDLGPAVLHPVPRKTRRPPRRRLVQWASVVAVAVVALVTGSLVVFHEPGSRSAEPASPASAQDYQRVVSDFAPLATGRLVSCGGAAVPVAVLAHPGGAEHGSSEAAKALRAFLDDNPWRDTQPVARDNWLLLSQTPTSVVFGRRVGEIGVDTVVTMAVVGGNLRPTELGGCGLLIPNRGEHSATVLRAVRRGSRLDLTWANSVCGSTKNAPDQLPVRTEVAQTATGVHVLVVTRDNPEAKQSGSSCPAVALRATSSVNLQGPVSTSKVYDDAHVPGQLVSQVR